MVITVIVFSRRRKIFSFFSFKFRFNNIRREKLITVKVRVKTLWKSVWVGDLVKQLWWNTSANNGAWYTRVAGGEETITLSDRHTRYNLLRVEYEDGYQIKSFYTASIPWHPFSSVLPLRLMTQTKKIYKYIIYTTQRESVTDT